LRLQYRQHRLRDVDRRERAGDEREDQRRKRPAGRPGSGIVTLNPGGDLMSRLRNDKERAMRAAASYAMALVLLAVAGYANADARSDYYQRAAARDTAAFHALDINHDGVVERSEIVGDNDFGPRFHDMDRNGDGIVTEAELALYIRDHYGVDEPAAARASMATEHVGGTTAMQQPTNEANAK
jgi:hypothetical protein